VQRWSWVIPHIYAVYIAELKLLKLQQSEFGGLPYTLELFPDVFLMRIHRHRII
jgi:hypothetical protein